MTMARSASTPLDSSDERAAPAPTPRWAAATRCLRTARAAARSASNEPATTRYDARALARLLGDARGEAVTGLDTAPRTVAALPQRARAAALQTKAVASSQRSAPARTARRESTAVSAPAEPNRPNLVALRRAARGLLLASVPLATAALTVLALRTIERSSTPLLPSRASLPAQTLTTPDPERASTVVTTTPDHAPTAAPRVNAPLSQPQTASTALEGDAAPPALDAIGALSEGRYREALVAYRALARAQPERAVYAVIASVLERRLGARCRQQAESGALPCATPPR
jgi:hypothetical protein